MADKRARMDPFSALPADVTQVILVHLPITDTWRLRSVCRSWRRFLEAEDALRTTALRWKTHDPNARASRPSHPDLTPAQECQRISRHLAGRPAWYTSIMTGMKRDAGYTGHVLLHRQWLAFTTTSDFSLPLSIVLCNLITGEKWMYRTETTQMLRFELTTEMVAYADALAKYDRRHSYGMPVENVLVTISLDDHSVQTVPFEFKGTLSKVRAQTAHKSCVATIRGTGQGWESEHIHIFDRKTKESWSYTQRDETRHTEAVYELDADSKRFTRWTTRSATGLASMFGIPNASQGITIERQVYHFAGELISRQEMQINPPVDISYDLGRSVRTRWLFDIGLKVLLRLDNVAQQRSSCNAYQLPLGGLCWKDLMFHTDGTGRLFINRGTTGIPSHARPVTSCNLERCIQRTAAKHLTEASGVLWAANESYLVVSRGDSLVVFSFDELAHDQADEKTSEIVWKSAQSLFEPHVKPRT